MTTTHPATQITITRAEGPADLCDIPRIFTGPECWHAASAWLLSQEATFPETGGYDKHDFAITFADGYVYEGRLDCQGLQGSGDPDLDVAAHVRGFLRFHAGERRPAHMTQRQYLEYLARRPEAVEECRALLETYAIPESIR